MNQDYITPNEWSIIEEGFDPKRVESSESLFSLGNGAMGQRANFEELQRKTTCVVTGQVACVRRG